MSLQEYLTKALADIDARQKQLLVDSQTKFDMLAGERVALARMQAAIEQAKVAQDPSGDNVPPSELRDE